MASPTPSQPKVFPPILTWAQVHEALVYVTAPESKLALIPAIMKDLNQAASEPRAYALTLAMQIALLSDKSYDPSVEVETSSMR